MEQLVFKIKYLSLPILFLVFLIGCKNDDKNDFESKENHKIEEVKCEDFLWNEIVVKRKKILKESDKERKQLMSNFKLLDNYLFSFSSLKSIHKDSLSIHAPLNVVNKRVDEYNQFMRSNLDSTNWDSLIHFENVKEYLSDDRFICTIMRNELTLYEKYGY